MKRINKSTAYVLALLMLFACFAGSLAVWQGTSPVASKATAGPRYIPTTVGCEEKGLSTNEGNANGIQLYAYRSWSETEQRDYVTFNTSDITNIESLWSFPGGMISAEYFDGIVYAIDDNLSFHAINAEDGAATTIGTLSCIIYDLTYDYTSATMFGISFSYSDGYRQLARIDLTTGEITTMGAFSISANMISLAAGRTPGVLYGIDDAGEVYTIDSTSAECELLGSSGFTTNYATTMTYSYEDDFLYWEHNPGQQLIKIDPTTGECKELGVFPNYAMFSGMSVRADAEDLPALAGGNSVTEVILDKDAIYTAPGVSKQLTVTIVPFNADNQNLLWSTSNSAVATVSSTGLVTGVAAGEAIITVTSEDGGHTDTCTVTVSDEDVELMGFRLYSTDGGYGDYLTFTDTNPEDIEVKWTVPFEMYSSEYYNGELFTCDWSNSSFSKVNLETGELTSIGPCNFSFLGLSYDYTCDTMFALTFTGSHQIICAVDLSTGETTEICAIQHNATFRTFSVARDGNFYAIDENGDLYIIDDNGNTELVGPTGYTNIFALQSMAYDYMNDCLLWASFPTGELIRVDQNTAESKSLGLIGAGTQMTALTIITHDEYLPDPVNSFPVTGVTVDPTAFTVAPGITQKLTASVFPWNADDKSVTWSSSDETVAVVNENGVVTGVSEGIATITVTTTDGGFTATSVATVLDSGIELRGCRVFSNGSYGDCVSIFDYAPEDINSTWIPRSMIYAGDYYDGKLYGYAQNVGMFFEMDEETGDTRVIGPCQYQIYEMAFDYTTRSMYCMVFYNNQKYLGRIDLNTADVTLIGVFDSQEQLLTLCSSNDGNFYGIDFNGDFYKIDKDAHCTLIGNTGFTANFLQSMTYDYSTDTIYWAQYPDGNLVKIDPETGIGTSLGLMPDAPEIGAFYTICDESYLPEFIGGVAVTGVTISKEQVKMSPNRTFQLAATVEPFNAENRSITWTSSNTSKARVNTNGLVTAVATGTVTITAKTVDGNFTATSEITIVSTGTEFYAYRNNGIDKANDWVKFSDTNTEDLTSLWDAEQEIYGAEYVDGYLYYGYRFGNFCKANIETGDSTIIGRPETGYQIWGMTYNYLDETMYVLTYVPGENLCVLGEISMSDAKVHIIGNFGWDTSIQMIEAGRDGLYAMDANGNLLKVGDDASCRLVSSTDVMVPFIASLEYDYARDTFIWTQNSWGFNQDGYLISIDPATGTREFLGIIGEGGMQPILTALVTVPNEEDLPDPQPTPTGTPTPTPTPTPSEDTFTVTFVDWDDTVLATVEVVEGEDATAPEDPTRDGYVFTGWDGEFTNVTSDITVKATYVELGDANGDNTVNTGDAVTVLKYAVDIIEFTELQRLAADLNGDGSVNTGDAVSILIHCVEQ